MQEIYGYNYSKAVGNSVFSKQDKTNIKFKYSKNLFEHNPDSWIMQDYSEYKFPPVKTNKSITKPWKYYINKFISQCRKIGNDYWKSDTIDSISENLQSLSGFLNDSSINLDICSQLSPEFLGRFDKQIAHVISNINAIFKSNHLNLQCVFKAIKSGNKVDLMIFINKGFTNLRSNHSTPSLKIAVLFTEPIKEIEKYFINDDTASTSSIVGKINLQDIYVKQNASDCFIISFLQTVLNYYKELDISEYITYKGDQINLTFAKSIYCIEEKDVVKQLKLSGYFITLDDDIVSSISISQEKLQEMKSSPNNLKMNFNRADLDKLKQQYLFEFILILCHFHGRVIAISENIDIEDNVSMEAFSHEKGNKLFCPFLLGFEHKYELSLINFLQHQDTIIEFVKANKILMTMTMFYTVKFSKKDIETFGHSWSIINFDKKRQTFQLYNPHGHKEEYPVLLLAHYRPYISIFTDIEDFSVDSLDKIEDSMQDISTGYSYGEDFIIDHGNSLIKNIVFLFRYEDESQKLFIQYHYCDEAKKRESSYTGIYQNKFYQNGALVKNSRTNYVLYPNTSIYGEILSSDRVIYARY